MPSHEAVGHASPVSPRVLIEETAEAASYAAAELMRQWSDEAIKREGSFRVALSGGTTPLRLFQILRANYRDKIDWSRTEVFWADERLVDPACSESNFGTVWRELLQGLPLGAVDPMWDGQLDPEVAAAAYDERLRAVSAVSGRRTAKIDAVLLGVGQDGHTASLFPDHASLAPTEDLCIHVKAPPISGADRLSLSAAAIAGASIRLFLVTGAAKAAVTADVLRAKHFLPNLPATLWTLSRGPTIFLLDRGAATALP